MTTLTPRELAGLIDHTLLKPEATATDIKELCREAVTYGFKAVCLNPCYVPLAQQELNGAPVLICSVIGFPLGADTTKTKITAALEALSAGAVELDVVMNIGFFKSGLYRETTEDLRLFVQAAKEANPKVLVKVILENCLLTDQEKETACNLAVEAGADFVKTSTGFSLSGATVADVKLMRQTVGPHIGIKAAGGIRTLPDALSMLEAGATRLGASNSIAILRGEK